MAHLKIEILDQVNLRLTCVYTLGPKHSLRISVVENTTLIPHDMASEFYDYDELKTALDPEDMFEISELQMHMCFFQYVYKHIDMSEWVELLKQPRNCRVTMLDNKVKVYYV